MPVYIPPRLHGGNPDDHLRPEGPARHEGHVRVGLAINLYLSQQEYAGYERAEGLCITLGEPEGSPPGSAASLTRPRTGRPATPRRAGPPLPAPGEPTSHPHSAGSAAKEHSDGRP